VGAPGREEPIDGSRHRFAGNNQAMDDRSLARYFAGLAETLLSVRGVTETMEVLVDAAVEVVDGADHASLSHIRGRALVSASSNDEVGSILDGIQTGADEGPCLDAIRTAEIMISSDLRSDPRWPRYGPAAVDATGVHSSFAHPLRDEKRAFGALNLFANEVDAFSGDPDQEALITILAAHCAPALAAALHHEAMEAALRTRDIIGQAKGMLMARTDVDEDGAFRMLVSASQRMNVKLAEVARRLVEGRLAEGNGDA
jgi:transcriptional regulator with GAF, ATPase, and Fis domain